MSVSFLVSWFCLQVIYSSEGEKLNAKVEKTVKHGNCKSNTKCFYIQILNEHVFSLQLAY